MITGCGSRREGVSMAARRKKKGLEATIDEARSRASKAQASLVDNVQQIWLAGMGAVAKAQQEGPGAFQEAVAEGLGLLNRSRSTAEKMIRDVFESAHDSVQSRLENARGQATETWDNLEALFQGRVQKALQQIGVPSAGEIRILTQRVADLNDSVRKLTAKSGRPARAGAKRPAARVRTVAKGKGARRRTARRR
jgi:poly(hydroxyalkanoate) granule-associated protein